MSRRTYHLSTKPACPVSECQKPGVSKGFCQKHYFRFKKHGDATYTKLNRGVGDTPEARYWSRIALTADPNRCWEWQAYRKSHGYGTLMWNGKRTLAHRVAYELFYGTKPELFVLHSCDNPPCCNPHHLREGTVHDNIQDKVDRKTAIRTHCIRGHELVGDNVFTASKRPGWRTCRTCNRDRANRSYWRRKNNAQNLRTER